MKRLEPDIQNRVLPGAAQSLLLNATLCKGHDFCRALYNPAAGECPPRDSFLWRIRRRRLSFSFPSSLHPPDHPALQPRPVTFPEAPQPELWEPRVWVSPALWWTKCNSAATSLSNPKAEITFLPTTPPTFFLFPTKGLPFCSLTPIPLSCPVQMQASPFSRLHAGPPPH